MHTVANSGTYQIGGDLPVHRIGFGAMQLTGPGVWGPPGDEGGARALLRRAVELGINFVDTADVYGPGDNERLICEALHPYAADFVVATKVGMVRSGPATADNHGISLDCSEAHIRSAVEGSLRRLGLDRIDLYQLHRTDPAIPIEETMGIFRALRDEGKIRHVGLSQASVEDIRRARSVVDIATVQNVYNLLTRTHEDVLAYCAQNDIAFVPFWPLHYGDLAKSGVMKHIAARAAATPAQVALAWLLKKSPAIILIPGTSSIDHLEQNAAACDVELSEADMERLERLQRHVGPAVDQRDQPLRGLVEQRDVDEW